MSTSAVAILGNYQAFFMVNQSLAGISKFRSGGSSVCMHPQKVTRSTPSGYWKKTGEDKKVREKETGTVIGTKKILVFYEGQGKNGVKTNYVVHEYHLHGDDFDRTHVLCRLKLKRDKKDESYLGNITLADLELDYDHESSFLEDLVQAGMNSLREFIPPENQLQPALGGSQNNSFPSDIHQLTNTEDPSGMDTSLDNEDVGDVQFAALAYAEVLGHKERGSAGNSTKKTNKENEYAGEIKFSGCIHRNNQREHKNFHKSSHC